MLPGKKVKRILVIKLRHHGDMLLISPVINTLNLNYPDAEVDVLLYQETRDMLECHPGISQIQSIDRNWKKQGVLKQIQHEYRLLAQLRSRDYDLVINLADQWRSALLTRITGARMRLGFDFPKRRGIVWKQCHTHLVTIDAHPNSHTVEQNLAILTPLQLTKTDQSVTMSYDEQDQAFVENLLREKHIHIPYIVIQPTSRWFYKCWQDEKFAQTIQELDNQGYHIVLTSGPAQAEKVMIENILSHYSSPGLTSLSGQLTLRQLSALIDSAALFIGVDSVPMHMAAALKTPCIALFGPSKLTFWRPWQAIGSIIWAGNYTTLPDPDDIDTKTSQRYLDAIPVADVVKAAKELLA